VGYRCILADPPWPQPMVGRLKTRPHRPAVLPYPPMSLDAIRALPVGQYTETAAHLWLWTTNAFLRDAFDVMATWGFTYLAPITWVKPSGIGAYFIHRTEHLLFGYRGTCHFPLARYRPTVLFANRSKHSRKPEASYDLIESISPGPRLEMFARVHRLGWDAWGDEVTSTLELAA
jgi:N6-adenosine-specific RNA methylase IME4